MFSKELRFIPCAREPCVYTRNRCKSINLIAEYVDDLLVARSRELIDIKESISRKFKVTDSGLNHFPGIRNIAAEGNKRLFYEVKPKSNYVHQHFFNFFKSSTRIACTCIAWFLKFYRNIFKINYKFCTLRNINI